MKFLLIEDDEEKTNKIFEFLHETFPGSNVDVARSFSSGLRTIINSKDTVDVLLLDMSMPNFDVSPHEPGGGKPENFAGEELLAQMKLRGVFLPTIVITMFDSFGEETGKKSFRQLEEELTSKFSGNFRGMVYYNSAQVGWRSSLKNFIDEISSS
jgi:hypothetical protein